MEPEPEPEPEPWPEEHQEEEEAAYYPEQRQPRAAVATKKTGALPPLPKPYVKKETRAKGPLPPLPNPKGGQRSNAPPPKKPLPQRMPSVVNDYPTETVEIEAETLSPREHVDSYSNMSLHEEESYDNVPTAEAEAEADTDTLEISTDVSCGACFVLIPGADFFSFPRFAWPCGNGMRVGGIACALILILFFLLAIRLPEDVETSLPLQPGDRLTILEIADEWAMGVNQDGFQGWFPIR